jgi:hypothetical protein
VRRVVTVVVVGLRGLCDPIQQALASPSRMGVLA